eukprot:354893-Chlamydomonas_euryale.AAC.3
MSFPQQQPGAQPWGQQPPAYATAAAQTAAGVAGSLPNASMFAGYYAAAGTPQPAQQASSALSSAEFGTVMHA